MFSVLKFGEELKASIIAGTISVPTILGWESGGSFERRTEEAVPGPQALSWMIDVSVMGAIWGVIWAKRLMVLFPVWRG